jgi:hypothetical protein
VVIGEGVSVSISGSEGSEGGYTSIFEQDYLSNGYSWYYPTPT